MAPAARAAAVMAVVTLFAVARARARADDRPVAIVYSYAPAPPAPPRLRTRVIMNSLNVNAPRQQLHGGGGDGPALSVAALAPSNGSIARVLPPFSQPGGGMSGVCNSAYSATRGVFMRVSPAGQLLTISASTGLVMANVSLTGSDMPPEPGSEVSTIAAVRR